MSCIKWSCKYCTYDNYPASMKCVVCCQPKNSPLIEPPPVASSDTYDAINSSNIASHSKHGDIITDHCPVDDSHVKRSNSEENLENEQTDESEASCKLKCASCTYYNDPTNDKCAICKLPLAALEITGAAASHNSSESDGKQEENKWTCGFCTYKNWMRSQKCVLCLKPKYTNDEINSTLIQYKNANTSASNDTEINYEHNFAESSSSTQNTMSTSLSVPNASTFRSRSSSSSSNSSVASSNQECSSSRKNACTNNAESPKSSNNRKGACSDSLLQRSRSRSRISTTLRKETKSLEDCNKESARHVKHRVKNLNLLFLKACIGVVDDNLEAVQRYLTHGGSIARALTAEEVKILNRPSAFDTGHTLVHLAIRFRRHQTMALILQPEVANRALKRCPCLVCPDLTDMISHEIHGSIRTRKGEFHCRYFCENVTFQLPMEITDIPSTFRKLLFEELLDQDAQKELEDDSAINWCREINHDRCHRLYALWNRSAGDCLLDSVLQATWGIFDKDNILRRAMAETLHECAPYFYKRWKEWELMQARMLGYSLTDRQCLQDWTFILSLAQQPGASLEHCHIFVLAHVLRRPIIVYSVKYLKSYHGDTLGFTKFQGVYIPFFWDSSFCWKSPIALGFTRGHFSALVSMETDGQDGYVGGAQHPRTNQPPSPQHAFLPLVDSNRKILPIHFTGEAATEAERECLLYEWLDCHVTNTGILVAKQKTGKRPPLVTRMLDQWLDHYRHLSIRRLGEVGDSEEE